MQGLFKRCVILLVGHCTPVADFIVATIVETIMLFASHLCRVVHLPRVRFEGLIEWTTLKALKAGKLKEGVTFDDTAHL